MDKTNNTMYRVTAVLDTDDGEVQLPIAHVHDRSYEPESELLAESHWQKRADEFVAAGANLETEYIFVDPSDEIETPFPSIRGPGYTALALPVHAVKEYTYTEVS